MVIQASDEVLLRAARRGDLEAYGELMQRHELRVYRLALRMLGSPSDAEDAAQETFLQAWRSIRRFRGDSAVSTWFYRIATNRCLNMIEARRPTAELDADRHADTAGDPHARAEQNEQMTALTASIARLPAEQRAALVLREFEGLSYDEVAEVLDVSLAAVKGRIHRGRLQIAVDLEGLR